MNTAVQSENSELYDVQLTEIDESSGFLTFEVDGTQHRVKAETAAWSKVGTVGRLRVPPHAVPFSFYAYPDQRLRRLAAQDDPEHRLWSWQIGERCVKAKAGIVPGKDGSLVKQDTETLALKIPREFVELCRTGQLLPETVLRGFVADLCALQNWVHCPREDNYSSNGSDERRMAQDYFYRAYGWLFE
jgi:hypothetical protein